MILRVAFDEGQVIAIRENWTSERGSLFNRLAGLLAHSIVRPAEPSQGEISEGLPARPLTLFPLVKLISKQQEAPEGQGLGATRPTAPPAGAGRKPAWVKYGAPGAILNILGTCSLMLTGVS